MSVLSQVNWLGNQRVELQHLRAIDSYVQQDFEALSLVLAGSGGAVVSGVSVTADSATVTVTIADNAVVLMPSGSDGVMFANLTGAPITKTITRNTGAAQDVYLNVARSESGTSVPYTFIDPNTKKAFTQMKSDSRVLVVSANSSATGIKVASINSSDVVTLENRLFGDTIGTLKDYVAQTDSALGAVESDVSTLEGQMSAANGSISTLQGQMTTANTNIGTLQTGSYAKVEYSDTSVMSSSGLFLSWSTTFGDTVKTSDISVSGDTITFTNAGYYLLNLSGCLAVTAHIGSPSRGTVELFVSGTLKEVASFGPVSGSIVDSDRYTVNFSYIVYVSASGTIRVRFAPNSGSITPSWSTSNGGSPVIFTITKIGQ